MEIRTKFVPIPGGSGRDQARANAFERALLEQIRQHEQLTSLSESVRYAIRFTAKNLGVDSVVMTQEALEENDKFQLVNSV